MRSRPKLRRMRKWVSLCVSILFLAAWGFSRNYNVQWVRHNVFVAVQNGRLHCQLAPASYFLPPMQGWTRGETSGGWQWKWYFQFSPPEYCVCVIPLWAPAAVLAALAASLWQFDRLALRRSRERLCLHCGYDLRGIESGSKCPECGMVRA